MPNIPVYYAGYRVYSHYSAWIGVNTLQAGLHNADARSKRTLLTQIEQWRQDGIQFSEDSWALRILREDKRCWLALMLAKMLDFFQQDFRETAAIHERISS